MCITRGWLGAGGEAILYSWCTRCSLVPLPDDLGVASSSYRRHRVMTGKIYFFRPMYWSEVKQSGLPIQNHVERPLFHVIRLP